MRSVVDFKKRVGLFLVSKTVTFDTAPEYTISSIMKVTQDEGEALEYISDAFGSDVSRELLPCIEVEDKKGFQVATKYDIQFVDVELDIPLNIY